MCSFRITYYESVNRDQSFVLVQKKFLFFNLNKLYFLEKVIEKIINNK